MMCGGVEVDLHAFLKLEIDGGGLSDSLPGRFVPRGKSPPVPTEYEARWTPESVWTRWRREKLPVLVGNRTLVVQPVA
jgi:hypothetical protein